MAELNHPSAGDLNAAAPLGRVAESAFRWHRTQLAVLGFIGFCGLFWDGGSVAGHTWAQGLVMVLVALGFVLAIVAIFVVGRVAHAFEGLAETTDPDPESAARQVRQLRTGVRMTYVAVALVVAATLTAWLPPSADDGAVGVAVATGQTWCGQLVEAPAGEMRLATADGLAVIPLDRVVGLGPVADC